MLRTSQITTSAGFTWWPEAEAAFICISAIFSQAEKIKTWKTSEKSQVLIKNQFILEKINFYGKFSNKFEKNCFGGRFRGPPLEAASASGHPEASAFKNAIKSLFLREQVFAFISNESFDSV